MKATLFMLMSLDGKISTGSSDERDFDKDLPNIPGLAEGLPQYYGLEQQTDAYSFNTGKVMAKVGWNEPKDGIEKIPVSFVIVDNQPHLTVQGVNNLLQRCNKVIIATTNRSHPALSVNNNSLEIMQFTDKIDFKDLFKQLEDPGVSQMTVQSGGDMNAILLRTGLINEISIVVAPALIGGKDTPSLVGGESLKTVEDLTKIVTMNLIEAKPLANSYLHLRYSCV